MVDELLKIPLSVLGKLSLPLILQAEVPLSLIFTDFVVDFSIGQFLIV
jgi:hypothetical protein